jgi:hypothetical protein
MATQEFNGPYQSIYDAAMARLRANTAGQRGMALRSANANGVVSSGVSQIPQQGIDAEALRQEGDIGANVAQAQETERLQDKGVAQKKELLDFEAGLSAQAQDRLYGLQKKLAAAGQTGQLIGGGMSALGSYFGSK